MGNKTITEDKIDLSARVKRKLILLYFLVMHLEIDV